MLAAPFRRSVSVLLCAVLAACGGSDGSSSNPPAPNPPAPTPVDPAPAPTITLLAGTASGYGSDDGPAAQARFAGPGDLAYDSAGNAYVLDNVGIRKLSASGTVTTLVRANAANGFPSNATGLAVDGAGNVYVADYHSHVIWRATPQGELSIVAGARGESGTADGPRASARLFQPTDVAVDAAGNLYVTESSGNARVRKIAPDGQVSTLAGSTRAECTSDGSTYVCDLRDGAGAAARFGYPTSIAVDAAGNLAVSDFYALRRVTPAGVVSTVPGRFEGSGLVFGADGNLFVAGRSIVRIAPNGSATTLVEARTLGSESGVGGDLSYPSGIAIDAGGSVVFSDTITHTLRRIAADGTLSHIAGQATRQAYDDNAGGTTRFGVPTALTVDGSGNVYLVDEGRLRKITPQGKLSTVAEWQSGAGDSFIGNEPSAATIDASGNVYVADASQILKISPSGAVTRHAGVTTWSAQVDGPAATARFGKLHAITADAQGRLYVIDQEAVRVVETDGSVRTLAGQGDKDNVASVGAVDGQGSNARFAQPRGIAVDAAGNVYVADSGNGTIRKVAPSGLVSTLAGSAGQFGSVDGSGAAARFQLLSGLTIDSAGTLYASDTGDRTIRRITPAGAVTTLAGKPGADGLALGPLPGSLRAPGALAWHGGALYVVDSDAVVKITAPAQ